MPLSKSSILDAAKVHETIDRLYHRIEDRFPQAGLLDVCDRLRVISNDTRQTIRHINRPILWVRALTLIITAGFFAILYVVFTQLEYCGELTLLDFITATEAGINELILLALGFVFLCSLELRIKRRRVVEALNRLRNIVHIIDMHQLTKDPDHKSLVSHLTRYSPRRDLSGFELRRYLDYCSEMLSLSSKLGYLFIAQFNDPVATQAANELENLSTGLTRKIWQKIMIIRMEDSNSIQL